jgi:hypothetical protein
VKKSDEAMLLAVVCVVVGVGLFVMGFGIGVAYGREEHKAELHNRVEENNRLLKENIALREVKEQRK